MKRLSIFLLGLLTQILPASAQSGAEGQSLLWKVSGPGLKKSSWLFGTMHSICKDDYFFTPKMKEALAGSEQLVLEVDLSDPAMVNQYQQHLMLPEGKTLRDFFPDEQVYTAFCKQLNDRYGIDATPFVRFKPFMLLSMLSMKQLDCAMPESYEMNLLTEAGNRKLPVLGLESSLSQLQLFDRMPEADIRRMLEESLQEDPQADSTGQEAMVRHYRNQDIEALYKLIVSTPEFRQHEKELISGRNVQWMNTLMHTLADKSNFIAVGAGHLGGPQGLIRLMRNAGLKVEPVL